MKNETFIKEIYEPYNEAYALLKMIKDCGHDNSDDLWAEFAVKTEEFVQKHDTSKQSLFIFYLSFIEFSSESFLSCHFPSAFAFSTTSAI